MKTNFDEILVTQLGRSMRFFLNSSLILLISFLFFILLNFQQVRSIGLLFTSAPLVTAVFYFLVFLITLKRIERYGSITRNIPIVSRIISEYNKSYIINLVIGKIDSFIEY